MDHMDALKERVMSDPHTRQQLRAGLAAWWRGYSDVDLAVARLKLQFMRLWPAPGRVTRFTREEINALRSDSFVGRAGLI